MKPAQSYLDPVYDRYEQTAAQQAGIDPTLLRAIRTRGERSNADQVSSAGARSVYQIIPATRAGLIKNYGVDPYSSPQAAALGAALVLKEGLQRNRGDAQAAIGEYHGGIDRRNWGNVNAAYRARVGGSASLAARDIGPAARQYNVLPNAPGETGDTDEPEAISASPAQPQPGRTEQSDSFASLYRPPVSARQPGTMPQTTSADGAPDWSGWLDGYIRTVLNDV
ncbi:hypothetical protein BTH42_32025 [Burkholderia sp. SRS-W-2-2016]|uniref:transglycosylase SLT domain-containing protein n=1 Tax=Burkholderia sp. SRS-W-2-2016 TaxID=1926878 RepID=UPI00094B0A8A|nr:transglycosylase SLT domain-containing protein [Burkholderia sp. SRS-W-2-2016]OLL27476.1 hypothetical protein BTH42_32025 [Burkholderia sp. SRS-W-2-2016]